MSNKINFHYIGIIIITGVFFHLIYGLKTLDPTNINWLMSAYHDWGTHYLGWAFYRVEEWTFPLEFTKNYLYPVGTNPGFTDSIPLLALIFKPFNAILPNDFQYFGIWLFLCHFLIGYYTFKIFELFRIKKAITYLAIVFLICNPVLIFRGIHPALSAHWLFLASFYYYLIPTTKANSNRVNIYQVIIFFIAASVNPYLAAMIFLFNIIIPFKHLYFDKSINIKHFVFYPIVSFLTAILFWFAIGMIGFNEKTNLAAVESFNLYSFNLNSFFNSYGYFSRFLPNLGFVNDKQYEGFAYFGLGILFLILLSIVILILKIKQNKKELKKIKYLPLLITCFLLFLFSVTNEITFGTNTIYTLPLFEIIEKLGNIFRASGRFIWPLYYLIFLFSLLYFAKTSIKLSLKLTILAFLLFIQLYDIQDLILKNNLKSGKYHTALSDEKWIPILKNFDEIITYPPFQTTLSYKLDYQDLCFLALKAGKPITNGYVARINVLKVRSFLDSLRIKMDNGLIGNKLFITKAEYIEDFSVLINTDKVKVKFLDDFIFIYQKQKQINNYFNSNSKDNLKLQQIIEKLNSQDDYIIDNYKPFESNSIEFNFDSYSYNNSILRVNGWACLKTTKNTTGDNIFLVISNDKTALKVPATLIKRPDVTTAKARGNLDDSGFKIIIFTNVLDKGTYDLGIEIVDKNGIKSYTKTDKKLQLIDDKKLVKIKSIKVNNFLSRVESVDLENFFPIKSQNDNGLFFLENSTTKSEKIHLKKGNYKIIIKGISYPNIPIKGINAHFNVKNKGEKLGNFYLNENTKKINPSIDLLIKSNQEVQLEFSFDNDEMYNGMDRNARINNISILPN